MPWWSVIVEESGSHVKRGRYCVLHSLYELKRVTVFFGYFSLLDGDISFVASKCCKKIKIHFSFSLKTH